MAEGLLVREQRIDDGAALGSSEGASTSLQAVAPRGNRLRCHRHAPRRSRRSAATVRFVLAAHQHALAREVTDHQAHRRRRDVVQLIGVPAGRWGVGGRPRRDAGPAVTFGIREAALSRPDGPEIAVRLAAVTDGVAAVLVESYVPGVTVDLVGMPEGRSAMGGVLA